LQDEANSCFSLFCKRAQNEQNPYHKAQTPSSVKIKVHTLIKLVDVLVNTVKDEFK